MKAEASPAQPLLTLLQLGRRARAASDLAALGFIAVNETLQLLPYRQAALWIELGLPRVAAVSGLPQPDPGAPYVQWLGSVCRHLAKARAEGGLVDVASLPAPLQAEWPQWLPAHAVWLPLQREEQLYGGLLLAREDDLRDSDIALLKELADVYGHALASFRPRQHGLDLTIGWLRTRRAQRRLLIALGLVCLAPIRVSVVAGAEVLPKDPFLVRAPLDGVIERFDVRPNQAVKAGDALFSLDTTALRTRYEVARKAYDTAQEEYRQSAQAAVTSDKNRTDIALRRGQLQEKQVELDYTSGQLQRVQVKAERDGIAVFADANDWLGKAVAVGERILVVADPAKVELAVHLPAADHLDVAPGDVLTLYPQGSPLASFDARVASVAYRAEPTPGGYLAYRIKADFEPGAAAPRIGQLGTARVRGPWAPLVYVMLRRPLVAVRQWLGW
ncbi:MAG: efflux RND transporter periplasmic adaptor subunit [Roseateles sp.]|uniref:efflux RND transporter periplasmic adaptor subunit n=1 Tax=Roseateles sp. TaxID=1971397 RepID=UPI0040368694